VKTHDHDRLRQKTFATFCGASEGRLSEICRSLLYQQKGTWAGCRRGYDSLNLVEERRIDCGGFSVVAQHNPGRMASTEARIGEKDIAGRPCFLCADKIPDDQKMVRYRGHHMILCNPMPVFAEHFTVAFLAHVPQAIDTSLDTFLQLIDDFGDGWTVLYNGPRCGASAPDHLHFQVVTGGRIPIEEEAFTRDRWVPVEAVDGSVFRARGLGREVLLMEAVDAAKLKYRLRSYLQALARVSPPSVPSAGEPMINLAGFRKDGIARLFIFPRRSHRPAAFFLEGDERIAISPAIAEMAGIMVAPARKDYLRLTGDLVRGVYRDVTLDEATAGRAVEDLACCGLSR
jgi:hypothetical protein